MKNYFYKLCQVLFYTVLFILTTAHTVDAQTVRQSSQGDMVDRSTRDSYDSARTAAATEATVRAAVSGNDYNYNVSRDLYTGEYHGNVRQVTPKKKKKRRKRPPIVRLSASPVTDYLAAVENISNETKRDFGGLPNYFDINDESRAINFDALNTGLWASTVNVWPGQRALLDWSVSRATSCTASGSWSGARELSGKEITPYRPVPQRDTYTLSCRGRDGTRANSVTVITRAPTVEIITNYPVVRKGDAATISWQIVPDPNTEPNAECVVTGVEGSPVTVLSSTPEVTTGPLNNGRLVTLTCDIYGIIYTDQILVEVVASVFEG